jgi:NAD(P)-dependent dehydrogenase (short-subunit alcohol dehydrogenase family)
MRNGYLRGDRSRGKGREGEGGPGPSIINVSSLLALHGGFGTTAYSASKAGLLGFTRALATEYASHRVRVNAIVPGYISTDMTRELNQEDLEKRIPMGRFGKPEEVAKAALFLAENGYAHNCVVGIDGGLSAV